MDILENCFCQFGSQVFICEKISIWCIKVVFSSDSVNNKFPFSLFVFQSILNAADKHVFMVTEKQYKGTLDGSIPVVVQSVSNRKF